MVKTLNVTDLTKAYFSKNAANQTFFAVNSISFSLLEGEILGLLGPNGAGKTTTISMLLGILTPTSGVIDYFGMNLQKHRSAIMEKLGFASTYLKLPGTLTVYENLDIFGRLYGLSRNERGERIDKFLRYFDMGAFRDRQVMSLSAGQTTRVMLAKAFLNHPKVVLLDEPSAALDPHIAHEMRNFILKQRDEFGVSILFASHNMDEVSAICDRVLVMQSGKIIADDTAQNLAASVSDVRVHLVIERGLDVLIAYLKEQKLEYVLEKKSIEIHIDEQRIAELLSTLAQKGVHYCQIYIEHPTLEDYFLTIARKPTMKVSA